MNTYTAHDLRHARRHLTALSIDKPATDSEIVELAIANGFKISATNFELEKLARDNGIAVTPAPAPATPEPTLYRLAALEWLATNRPAVPSNADMSDDDKISIAESAGFTYSGPAAVVPPLPPIEEDTMPAPATTDATAAALAQLINTLTPPAPAAPQFDEAALKAAVEKYANPTTTLVINRPAQNATVSIKGAHPRLKDLVVRLNGGKHVMLYGGAGVGKSTLAEQAAESLGLDFYFTGAVTMEHKLIGYQNAEGVFIGTQLFEAWTKGGVFLIDELDASNPAAVIALNTALANKKMAFAHGVYDMHSEFRCVATANTNGLGATANFKRVALDGASLDRFLRLTIEVDNKLEQRLAIEEYTRQGGEDIDVAKRWVKLVQAKRKAAVAKRLDVIISPRSSINGAAVLAFGDDTQTAINETFGASLSLDQRRQLDLEGAE